MVSTQPYAFIAVIYQFIANSTTPLSYIYIFLFQEDFECFKRQKVQMVIAIKLIGISKLDKQDTSIFLGKVRVSIVLSYEFVCSLCSI